jgi:hypothetical protein
MSRVAFGGIAMCVVTAAMAPACRQVSGIHERSSEQALCQACVDGSCAKEESTCEGSPSCASRLACTLACDPTDRDDITCKSACEAKSAGDAASLGAISSCMAGACVADCAIQCGDVLPLTPPDAATACANCVASSCCSLASACAANADCLRGLECARGNSAGDVVETCTDVRYAAGSTAYHAFDDCVAGMCNDECAVGADWSCVGKVVVPVPTTDSIPATITLVEAQSQSVPIPGLDVAACGSDDLACIFPVTPNVTTDANGTAQLTVPTLGQSGRVGFTGYVQITDPKGVYSSELAFAVPPVTQGRTVTKIIVGTVATGQTLASLLGVTLDTTKSVVLVTAVDCANRPAQDLTIDIIDGAGNHPQVFYTYVDIPSQSATETDPTGNGIAINVAPGLVGVTVHSIDLNRVVATGQMIARMGALTLVRVGPTP